ncbi:hypothetical protein OE810_10500 [Rhodobacteraceae bacterium XHP0102]|nr:hypothetical protein [Rhodobacteraceae bacterium XHP0102]
MSYEKMRGLALGILLGFLLSTGALWVLSSSHPVVVEHLATHLSNFVIVAAAALGLWGVSRQIQSNVELAEKTRIAKLDAARSCLPLVLSRICEICEDRRARIIFGDNDQEAELLRLSSDDFETLRACIEHSPKDEAEPLVSIIALYQILLSRWSAWPRFNLFSDHPENSELDRLQQYYNLQNWFALEARTSVLFDFSRGGDFPVKEDLEQRMRRQVENGMAHVNDARNQEVGWMLESRPDYRRFLERMRETKIRFVDDDVSFL